MASHAPPLRHRYRADPQQRAASLTLAIALVVLLIFLLIRMGVLPLLPTRPVASTSTFDVAPDRPTPSKQPSASPKQAAKHAPTPSPRAARQPPPPVPDKAVMPPGFIQLDGATFAQTDLRKVPRHPEDAAPAETADAGDGSGAGKARAGPGEGPGGRSLYAAAWYHEPPRTVLAPFLPKNMDIPSGSWGEIACRTVDRFRVEDCRELGESPAGIGLSRAMRRASDQFLVRPPRVDGKSMVGAWVRIHYDIVNDK